MMKKKTLRVLIILILSYASINILSAQGGDDDEGESKARAVIQKAIEAMGGDAYLNVNNYHQSGRYFGFRKGRKSFARYQDWTVYEPIKSRTQFGKGDSQYVQIYNLELKQGWTLEGKDIVEEIKPELIEDFYTNTVKRDMDYILKKRLNEEGMSFFYYSPDEVAGGGNFEAVEILDETNYSIVVFFDLDTHLPAKVENYSTDDVGVRHKRERELANWHVIQNVNVPLRSDYYTDGELSAQWFIEEVQFNLQMPAEFFLEPQIDE